MFRRAAPLIAALLVVSLVSTAQERKDDPKADEKLLVGKWKLAKTSMGELPEGLQIALELEKGKFKIIMTQGDVKDVNEGTWKLDGKKLTIEFTEGSRKGMTQTDTIKELTAKKLVLHDENDITEYWDRVEEKKK